MIGDKVVPPLSPQWQSCVAGLLYAALQKPLPGDAETLIGTALHNYQLTRFAELEASDDADVSAAIRQIESAASKLKTYLDGPKSKPREFAAAWSRLDKARYDHDPGESVRDVLYPGVAMLTARLTALRQKPKERAREWGSLTQLVYELANYVEAHGGRATASNGIIRKGDGDSLSLFVRLVKTCLQVSTLSPPCRMTDTALNKAVLVALKRRGEHNA